MPEARPAKPCGLGRDDDLRGLAVRDLLHGLKRLELEHLVVRGLFVQQRQRIGHGLLHGHDGLRFAVSLENCRLLFGFCLEDGGLLFRVCLQNRGFLFALGDKDLAALRALSLQDSLSAVTLGLHLFFHGVLDVLRRQDVLQLHAVDLDAPGIGGLVENGAHLVLITSRDVSVWSSSRSPMMLRSVVAVSVSMAIMGRSTP